MATKKPMKPRMPRRIKMDPIDVKAEIDYKNISLLQKYLTERGRMVSRRISGVTAKQQRQLTNSIKRARFLGLLTSGRADA